MSNSNDAAASTAGRGESARRAALYVPLDQIVPDPNQPRRHFDASIEEMAESLKRHGQLEPVLVRWRGELAKWMIVCGERRYRGAVRAGLGGLDCVVLDRPLSDAELREIQLVENIQREDLKPVELARSYRELAVLNGWSLDQLAANLKKSKATISRTMSLLKLPEDVLAQVDRGELAPSVAYELLKERTPEAQRAKAGRVVAEGLTRKEVTAKPKRVQPKKSGQAAAKARLASPAKKPRPLSRVFRLPHATVTVRANKSAGAIVDIVVMLEAALAAARSEGAATTSTGTPDTVSR